MTKAELLTDLGTIFYEVLTPILDIQNSDGNWNFYKVKVIDKLSVDEVTDRVVGFRVFRETDPAEEAFFVGRRPTAQDTDTFRAEVQAKLDTAIQNNQLNIKSGKILDVDERNEKVTVAVQRGDGGTPEEIVTEQYAVVYRDGANLSFIWYTKP